MGPTVLEIRLSFPDSVDDDEVSFFLFFVFVFLFSFSYYFIQYTYMFSTALIWRVFATVWVCNHDTTLCYYFYYYYDIER